jgi:hypothetical protein
MALYLTSSNYISDTQTTVDLNINPGGTATLTDVNFTNNLQLNGINGAISNVIVKTGATTQDWNLLSLTTGLVPGTNGQFLISDVSSAKWTSGTTYYLAASLTDITTANFNAATSNLITFGAGVATAFTRAKFGTLNFLGLDWVQVVAPYQTIICQNAGTYRFRFNIVLANASIGTTQIRLVIRINGVTDSTSIYSTILPLATSGNNIIAGAIYLTLAANDTLQFFSLRVNGTGTLNVVSSSSSINITCINTVSNL